MSGVLAHGRDEVGGLGLGPARVHVGFGGAQKRVPCSPSTALHGQGGCGGDACGNMCAGGGAGRRPDRRSTERADRRCGLRHALCKCKLACVRTDADSFLAAEMKAAHPSMRQLLNAAERRLLQENAVRCVSWLFASSNRRVTHAAKMTGPLPHRQMRQTQRRPRQRLWRARATAAFLGVNTGRSPWTRC